MREGTRGAVSHFRIRKGDLVMVIAGRDRGKQGKVLRIVPQTQNIFVEKLAMIKRHTKPSQKAARGGIIEKEGPIHISKVMVLCGNCGKPTRVGIKVLETGGRMRSCKKCGEVIDKG